MGPNPFAGIIDLDNPKDSAAAAVDRLGSSAPEKSLLEQAWAFLSGQKDQLAAPDEEEEKRAQEAQQNLFGTRTHMDVPTSAGYVGAGAAMQTLMDLYNKSGGQAQGAAAASKDFPFQSLIDKAMSNAASKFDQQQSRGQIQQGATKEGAMSAAGKMMLQFLLKSQGGGSTDSSKVSLGSLVQLASKFM